VKRVTVDSNVYVSALIWGGKPLQLLELGIQGDVEIAISPDILTETLRILRDKFKLDSEDMATAERFIMKVGKVVTPNERLDVVRSDPDDNHVVECAVARASDTIVSGDIDLLRMDSFRGIQIVKVSDFLAGLQGRGR
jgi:putative PIN family toxin of toxin-antitoxin system